jgi:hypothetical protein
MPTLKQVRDIYSKRNLCNSPKRSSPYHVTPLKIRSRYISISPNKHKIVYSTTPKRKSSYKSKSPNKNFVKKLDGQTIEESLKRGLITYKDLIQKTKLLNITSVNKNLVCGKLMKKK